MKAITQVQDGGLRMRPGGPGHIQTAALPVTRQEAAKWHRPPLHNRTQTIRSGPSAGEEELHGTSPSSREALWTSIRLRRSCLHSCFEAAAPLIWRARDEQEGASADHDGTTGAQRDRNQDLVPEGGCSGFVELSCCPSLLFLYRNWWTPSPANVSALLGDEAQIHGEPDTSNQRFLSGGEEVQGGAAAPSAPADNVLLLEHQPASGPRKHYNPV